MNKNYMNNEDIFNQNVYSGDTVPLNMVEHRDVSMSHAPQNNVFVGAERPDAVYPKPWFMMILVAIIVVSMVVSTGIPM